MSLGRFDAEITRDMVRALQQQITDLRLEVAQKDREIARLGHENNELCDRIYELTHPQAAE